MHVFPDFHEEKKVTLNVYDVFDFCLVYYTINRLIKVGSKLECSSIKISVIKVTLEKILRFSIIK